MSWFLPSFTFPDAIKKRVCIYLLQRYLGQFLEEKLTLDQLSLDLYNGSGAIENVSLDVQALNELGEKQNWPIEFVNGTLKRISFKIPWTAMLKESTFIEIHGLSIIVQPKQRSESATSMFESMWSSMTNSMQLAQECMKQEAPNLSNSEPLEGIEIFAQAIDSILSRVKIKFLDTDVQIEHVPKNSQNGVGVLLNIEVMEYLDEAGNDPPTGETVNDGQSQNKSYLVTSFTTKKFYLDGVSLSTIEFPSTARTFSNSVIIPSSASDRDTDDVLASLLQRSRLTPPPSPCSSDSDNEPIRHVILFGKFSGRQEVRVRLKQTEDVNGPKVSVEVNCGAFSVFLSPRQVYVLLELVDGLTSPDMEDTSNVAPRQKCVEKPMTGLDYQRVEQELQQQLHPAHAYQNTGLQAVHGWSTADLENESDNDDNFLPMRAHSSGSGMFSSAMSNASSSMESSFSSSMMSSASEATTNRSRRRGANIDLDPTAELSHFHIRFASLAMVLLHEDILTVSNDKSLTPFSVLQMQKTSIAFFDSLGQLALNAYGRRNFDETKRIFERACRLSHMRLMAAPIQVECDETTTLTAFSLVGKMNAAKLEVLEVLPAASNNGMEYVRLLSFSDDKEPGSSVAVKPCFKMSFKHIERTVKSASSRRIYMPKTDLTLNLDSCTVEIDITLMDRISTLINSDPVCVIEKDHNVWMNNLLDSTSTTDSHMDIKIFGNCLIAKLRFPIPDFRPAHDQQRPPWWKRNVRPNYLSLKMQNFLFETSIESKQIIQSFSCQCKCIDAFYYEKENESPLHMAKAGSIEKEMPRVTITINPETDSELIPDNMHGDIMTQSMYGHFNFQTTNSGPFSAKRVIHESDIPRPQSQQEDSQELIIPGDTVEMNHFIESSTKNSRIQLDICLPTVSIQFHNKHIYEVIYNHITSDLLLWEPSAPASRYRRNSENMYFMNNLDKRETYTLCKSGIQFDSDSDSSDDLESEETNVFYSMCDTKSKSQHEKVVQKESRSQNYLSLNLNVQQGLLSFNPPVRDNGTNVIPEQHGEFVIGVEEATIFTVSGYEGDDNLGYVCVQAKTAHLHHCDMITTPSLTPPLKEVGCTLPKHLFSTVYKSDSGALPSRKQWVNNREMLSVAVKIQANHETHHVKTVRVAVGVNKATLKHRMCQEPNSWITQLIDFFNIVDYPLPGYHAKDVLTELHLHLWGCAIDYRPVYLPLRSVVTLGTFSMSSHLSAVANTSILRFIAEDCGLFLSDKVPCKNGNPAMMPIELKRDYIGVVDLALFELNLRTNDKSSGINPHIDLKASNNIVNIRTCSDTARALMQLITYFANDGDLVASDAGTSESSFSSPRHSVDQELVNVEQQDTTANITKSEHQQVSKLLSEAMEESLCIGGSSNPVGTGAKMFFFPDEGQLPCDSDNTHQYEVIGDTTFRSNKSSDTDDDFCIIGEEAGLGILPKNGLPEIRWLTEDPLRILENHFNLPRGKTDILKPPKHFPTPVMRYTLCDMSVNWQMYGGNDFRSSDLDDRKEKKSVNFSDSSMESVGYSNTRTGEIIFNSAVIKKKKPKLDWIKRGGPNRDHNVLIELQVNKIRFQHEIYPDNTTQASRQVLLVTELEVIDRLQSSQIKKFLYEYTSQSRPKKSHAHMITVKAIHVRPDLKLKAQECCLKVSLLPLRLNIDQDSLLFLIKFFTEISGAGAIAECSDNLPAKLNTPTHQPPVMTISTGKEKESRTEDEFEVEDNLMLLDDVASNKGDDNLKKTVGDATDSAQPIYFRKVLFTPEVPIKLDYSGRHIDLTHGAIAGLIMGLGQLNSSELRLKRLSNSHGLLGFDKLLTFCLHEWINDLKKNQISNLLAGVGPMASLVQFVQGIKDLFWMPIEQYQKDGRIVRGLQRGANSFTTSTAMAALELTSRIIHLIQLTAETAYDMMSPGPSVKKAIKAKGRKRRYNQPQDLREGFSNAVNVVIEGLERTAENMAYVASHEREQKGISGAVGGVIRQIPPTLVKPIIIASEATNNVLGGMQSQLLPDVRREANQKWKNDDR